MSVDINIPGCAPTQLEAQGFPKGVPSGEEERHHLSTDAEQEGDVFPLLFFPQPPWIPSLLALLAPAIIPLLTLAGAGLGQPRAQSMFLMGSSPTWGTSAASLTSYHEQADSFVLRQGVCGGRTQHRKSVFSLFPLSLSAVPGFRLFCCRCLLRSEMSRQHDLNHCNHFSRLIWGGFGGREGIFNRY